MPVPVFCCFCIPEKLVRKYSRNWTKIYGGPYFIRRHLESEGETKWSHEGPTRGLGTAKHLPAPRGSVVTSCTASRRPLAYILLLPRKPKKDRRFPQKSSRAPPPSETLIRGTEVSVSAPCRDGELPPEPSPSTPPPPSSSLLPPMMRRE